MAGEFCQCVLDNCIDPDPDNIITIGPGGLLYAEADDEIVEGIGFPVIPTTGEHQLYYDATIPGAPLVYVLENGVWTKIQTQEEVIVMSGVPAIPATGEQNIYVDQTNPGDPVVYVAENGSWTLLDTFEEVVLGFGAPIIPTTGVHKVYIDQTFPGEPIVYVLENGTWTLLPACCPDDNTVIPDVAFADPDNPIDTEAETWILANTPPDGWGAGTIFYFNTPSGSGTALNPDYVYIIDNSANVAEIESPPNFTSLAPFGLAGVQVDRTQDQLITDHIFHTGDITLGATEVSHVANSKLTVIGSMSVGDSSNILPGFRAVAIGNNNTADSDGLALGDFNVSGPSSISWGSNNNATGARSAVGGIQNDVTGDNSIAIGTANTVVQVNSSAIGNSNNPALQRSHCIGLGNISLGPDNLAFGLLNVNDGSANIHIGIGNLSSGSTLGNLLTGISNSSTHDDLFMFSSLNDGVAGFFDSRTDGEFAVRSYGGFRLYRSQLNGDLLDGVLIDSPLCAPGIFLETSAGAPFTIAGFGTGTGAHLTNAGVWTNASSREIKENFRTEVGVLGKIRDLDIKRWSYKKSPDQDHIGPMAEDWYDAFGLGSGNKTISTIDPSGVSLLAIQELIKRVEVLERRVLELEAKK